MLIRRSFPPSFILLLLKPQQIYWGMFSSFFGCWATPSLPGWTSRLLSRKDTFPSTNATWWDDFMSCFKLKHSSSLWFQRMWGPREPGWGPGWCLGSTQQCCTSLIYLQLLVGTVCWIQQHYCCFCIYYSYVTVVFPQWADGGAQEEQRERGAGERLVPLTVLTLLAAFVTGDAVLVLRVCDRTWRENKGGGVFELYTLHLCTLSHMNALFFFYLGIRSVYSISVPFRWRSAIFSRPKTKEEKGEESNRSADEFQELSCFVWLDQTCPSPTIRALSQALCDMLSSWHGNTLKGFLFNFLFSCPHLQLSNPEQSGKHLGSSVVDWQLHPPPESDGLKCSTFVSVQNLPANL